MLRRFIFRGLVLTASGRRLVRLRHRDDVVVSGLTLSAPVDLLVAGLTWSCNETNDLATTPLSFLMTVLDLVVTGLLVMSDEGGVGGVTDEVESGDSLVCESLLDSGEETVGLGTSGGSSCKYHKPKIVRAHSYRYKSMRKIHCIYITDVNMHNIHDII